jgi:hypothetical protein
MPERFGILEELVRDLLTLKSDGDHMVHEEIRTRLLTLAAKTERSTLLDFFEDLLQTREAVLKINANISLSLQSLLLPLRANAVE